MLLTKRYYRLLRRLFFKTNYNWVLLNSKDAQSSNFERRLSTDTVEKLPELLVIEVI